MPGSSKTPRDSVAFADQNFKLNSLTRRPPARAADRDRHGDRDDHDTARRRKSGAAGSQAK